jgi:plasmid stability protein
VPDPDGGQGRAGEAAAASSTTSSEQCCQSASMVGQEVADMATLTIRNLEPELVERLKELSRGHGRSMEAEVRLLLAERVERESSAGSAVAGGTTPDAVRPRGGWTTVRPSGATWVDGVRSRLSAVDALVGGDELDARLARLREDGVEGDHRVPDLGAGS